MGAGYQGLAKRPAEPATGDPARGAACETLPDPAVLIAW
jgi:hypothetical protein